MENTENDTKKIQIGTRVDPAIAAAIEDIAKADERSISNTIERLLKQSPPIQERLAAEVVA
jgi:hypothetical protein